MGRKKSRRGSIKRVSKIEAAPNRFSCPECNHENVVVCKMNKANKTGLAFCNVCEAKYKCKINNLTTPIDIYTDWVDKTEAREE